MQHHALIRDGIVAEVIPPHPDGAPFEACHTPEIVAASVALTAAKAVAVRPGWTYDGTTFAPPAVVAPPAVPIRLIRALAFRERLPAAKADSLNVAAMQAAMAGDGSLLTFLLNQVAATVTDLDDSRVMAGVSTLQLAGLITATEAAKLLADGKPEEAP